MRLGSVSAAAARTSIRPTRVDGVSAAAEFRHAACAIVLVDMSCSQLALSNGQPRGPSAGCGRHARAADHGVQGSSAHSWRRLRAVRMPARPVRGSPCATHARRARIAAKEIWAAEALFGAVGRREKNPLRLPSLKDLPQASLSARVERSASARVRRRFSLSKAFDLIGQRRYGVLRRAATQPLRY